MYVKSQLLSVIPLPGLSERREESVNRSPAGMKRSLTQGPTGFARTQEPRTSHPEKPPEESVRLFILIRVEPRVELRVEPRVELRVEPSETRVDPRRTSRRPASNQKFFWFSDEMVAKDVKDKNSIRTPRHYSSEEHKCPAPARSQGAPQQTVFLMSQNPQVRKPQNSVGVKQTVPPVFGVGEHAGSSFGARKDRSDPYVRCYKFTGKWPKTGFYV
jgi:hypothetical protein